MKLAIKTVKFAGGLFPYGEDSDCVVLRMADKNALGIEVAFPFHEDTPNFRLSISEALNLRNAIDSLIDLKMLEKPRNQL